jgi:hypothetical protein
MFRYTSNNLQNPTEWIEITLRFTFLCTVMVISTRLVGCET